MSGARRAIREGVEEVTMEVTDLPLEIWQKEKSDSEEFYREAAKFIYKRPRHGPDGEGEGWWCRCGRVMRSLIGILHGRDARLKEFQDETYRQLSVCKLCVISYVENRWSWLSGASDKEAADRALKANFLARLDQIWGQPPAQGTRGKRASIFALLELLLDLDYCLDRRFADKLETILSADRQYFRVAEASSLLLSDLKRPPLGLYALCLSPATACREWSQEMVPVHAPIASLEDLDHVNVLFTEIVSRFVASKIAKGEQTYADQRTSFMQHLSFWQGLKFIISLMRDDLLRQFLVKQPGVVELLISGGTAQGSAAAKEVVEIILHLFKEVGYKFWLAHDGSLTPTALADYLSKWYHRLSSLDGGSSLVLEVIEPLLDSLAAFHPSTVRDVYEAILSFLARICEPMSAWASFKGYQHGTALAGNEKLARKMLISVALKGYEILQPDVPSRRVDWIRILFSAMRDDSDSLDVQRLFRALLITGAKNAFFSLHGQLGPDSQLPKPIEPEKENIHDIEPPPSVDPYPWNAVAGLLHRGSRASKGFLVMELETMLDVLAYVHFVDVKTDAIVSEKQRAANSMMEVIQASLGEYFTKVANQLRTRPEVPSEIKELLIPNVAVMVLCANPALLQKALLLLQQVLQVDADSQHPSALCNHFVRHTDRDKIFGGFRGSIALLNQLDTSMTMAAVKVSYLWLALLQQSCSTDNMLVARLRRQLGREETCKFIKNSLEELPPLGRLKAFDSTVSKVVVNLRKIWSLALFEDSRQRHSTLLHALLAWGRICQIAREWTNTVDEVISSYGPGDEECENLAANLMENTALTDQQRALLGQKYPGVRVQTTDPARKTHHAMGNNSSGRRPAVASGGASTKGADNAPKQLTKMERLRLQMQHKMVATGSKMAVQAATTDKDVLPKLATASKTRMSSSYDKPLTGDILAQRQQNETLRASRKRIRNIEDMHQAILQAPISEITGKKPNNKLEVEAYPSEFQSSEDYSSFWEPLLIEETKASIGRSYLELQSVSDDKWRSKFTAFRVALPPEKRDHFVFVTAELADEKVAATQKSEPKEMPSADDLVLLQMKKDGVPFELIAFVAEVTTRGGAPLRFTLKLCHETLPFSPGSQLVMATLTTLTTHQRQYEALWKAGDIQPRLLARILRPGTWARSSTEDSDQIVRTMCPPSVRRLLRKYSKTGILNNSQLRAVTEVAASTCNPSRSEGFTLLQGPPGTGKTSTILALLSMMLAQSLAGDEVAGAGRKKAKILVCAPSNAAVDEILVRVMQKGLDHWELDAKYVPRLLRVGTGTTKDEVKQVSLGALQGRSASNSAENESKSLAANVASRNSVREQLDQLQALISAANSERKLLRKQMSDHDSKREQKRGGETGVDSADDNEYEANLQEQRRENELAKDRKLTDKLTKLHNQKDSLNAQLGEKKRAVATMFDEVNRVRQEAQDELVSSALVVFTTLNSSGHYALRNMIGSFDCVIIDEAGQAVEPEVLIPLGLAGAKRAPSCVMVGDTKQLPATVLSVSKAVLEVYTKSLFERLENASESEALMLRTQYRMHPLISKFPSRQFYDSKLEDATSVTAKEYSRSYHEEWNRFGPMTFLDTSEVKGDRSCEERSAVGSLRNRFEVVVCMNAIKAMLVRYGAPCLRNAIAIISPYKSQVHEMRNAVAEQGVLSDLEIEVNTIDGIQGREKEFVFLSTVRSGSSVDAGIGFLKDVRRMNVAITRSKYSLVVIGHSEILLKNSATWGALVAHCRDRSCMLKLSADLSQIFPESFERTRRSGAPVRVVKALASDAAVSSERGAARIGGAQKNRNGKETRGSGVGESLSTMRAENADSEEEIARSRAGDRRENDAAPRSKGPQSGIERKQKATKSTQRPYDSSERDNSKTRKIPRSEFASGEPDQDTDRQLEQPAVEEASWHAKDGRPNKPAGKHENDGQAALQGKQRHMRGLHHGTAAGKDVEGSPENFKRKSDHIAAPPPLPMEQRDDKLKTDGRETTRGSSQGDNNRGDERVRADRRSRIPPASQTSTKDHATGRKSAAQSREVRSAHGERKFAPKKAANDAFQAPKPQSHDYTRSRPTQEQPVAGKDRRRAGGNQPARPNDAKDSIEHESRLNNGPSFYGEPAVPTKDIRNFPGLRALPDTAPPYLSASAHLSTRNYVQEEPRGVSHPSNGAARSNQKKSGHSHGGGEKRKRDAPQQTAAPLPQHGAKKQKLRKTEPDGGVERAAGRQHHSSGQRKQEPSGVSQKQNARPQDQSTGNSRLTAHTAPQSDPRQPNSQPANPGTFESRADQRSSTFKKANNSAQGSSFPAHGSEQARRMGKKPAFPSGFQRRNQQQSSSGPRRQPTSPYKRARVPQGGARSRINDRLERLSKINNPK